MSQNIYQPPESDLTKRKIRKIKRDDFDGSFDKTMKTAFCSVAAIEVFFFLVSLTEPDEVIWINILTSLFLGMAVTLFIVYIIRAIRGNIVVSKKHPEFENYLGVGGYVWRILVIKFFSILLYAPIILITGILNHLDRTSLALIITSTILLFPTSVVSTWLLFSQNRKAQFQWLFSLFRGY